MNNLPIDRLPRPIAFALMLGLMALPLVFIYLLHSMSLGIENSYGLVIIIIITLVLYAYIMLQAFDVVYTFRKEPPRNVTSENRPLPTTLIPAYQELRSLGFERFGETMSSYYGLSESDSVSWIMKNEDSTIFVEMVNIQVDIEVPFMVQFCSSWENNAALETSYPIGDFIDKPMFRSTGINNDISSAYKVHLRQMADFSRLHGEPATKSSMKEWMAWEHIYREVHGIIKILPAAINSLIVVSSTGTGIVASLLAAIPVLNVGSDNASPNLLISMILIAFVSFGISRSRIPRGADVRQKKKIE